MSTIRLAPNTAPATPTTGKIEIYVDTDKKLKTKDDAGLVRTFHGSGEALFARSIGSAAGDYTTSSGTPVKVSTDLDITLTCRGNPMELVFSGNHALGSLTSVHFFWFYMDGAQIEGAQWYVRRVAVTYNFETIPTLAWVFTPSAGSHTFSVYHQDGTGTGAYVANTNSTLRPCFWVREFV